MRCFRLSFNVSQRFEEAHRLGYVVSLCYIPERNVLREFHLIHLSLSLRYSFNEKLSRGVHTYGVFAQRNPVPRPRNDGTWISRSAARMASGPLPQEPPRITLDTPLGGPVGFLGGLVL